MNSVRWSSTNRNYAWGRDRRRAISHSRREKRALPAIATLDPALGLFMDSTLMSRRSAMEAKVAQVQPMSPTFRGSRQQRNSAPPVSRWAPPDTVGRTHLQVDRQSAHKGMIRAAEGMAISAARLIGDPSLLQAAKDEFVVLHRLAGPIRARSPARPAAPPLGVASYIPISSSISSEVSLTRFCARIASQPINAP